MNWYKSARRNPYETLANKFANEFFQWFIQQDYAKHYDANNNDAADTLGFTTLKLTEQDFDLLGMKKLFVSDLDMVMFVTKTNEVYDEFSTSASADTKPLVDPETSQQIPIIEVHLKIAKMNKNLWNDVKQQLHKSLRHEFEHLNQMSIFIQQKNLRSLPVKSPKDQKKYEFQNMRSTLLDTQLKLVSIKNKIKNETTVREVYKQKQLYCKTNYNPELCEKAEQDMAYMNGIDNKVAQSTNVISYFADPDELEAFGISLYYTARKKGTKVEDEIQDHLKHALINPNFPHPEIDFILYEAKNTIIQWMLRFVENRYPDYSKQRNQQLA